MALLNNVNVKFKMEVLEQNKNNYKLDAGKLMLGQFFLSFRKPLVEICKNYMFGHFTYGRDTWKLWENGEYRALNAMFRHLEQEEENLYDKETKLLHATMVAANALIRLYYILQETPGENPNDPIIGYTYKGISPKAMDSEKGKAMDSEKAKYISEDQM